MPSMPAIEPSRICVTCVSTIARRCAGIGRRDRDDRLVDVGILAHRQALERDHAEQHEHQAEHGREDRPADAELEKTHQLLPRSLRPGEFRVTPAGGCAGAGAAGTTSTAAPSRSFCWPADTTMASPSEAFEDFDLAVRALAES